MFKKFEELLTGPDRLKQTITEHRHIYQAIADGDRVAARQAMKLHLDTVLRAFSKGLGKK
jgi:DNA-binding FadR family transcriptional regulator